MIALIESKIRISLTLEIPPFNLLKKMKGLAPGLQRQRMQARAILVRRGWATLGATLLPTPKSPSQLSYSGKPEQRPKNSSHPAPISYSKPIMRQN